MNILIPFVIAAAVYWLGYRFYSPFMSKVFGEDDRNPTPAVQFNDDKDAVPPDWRAVHRLAESLFERTRDVLSESPEDTDPKRAVALPVITGDIAFEHVDFEYEAGRPVLRDVSFRAAAGTTTALVGSSGSGKSTLIGLVLAFHQPQRGAVRVDGHDLAGLRLREYRSHLAAVFQDNFLFDGTIAENIAYSRPAAPREEILAAARVAHCDEFVARFPDGYDTVIGERGVRLSGGQRQRVAIARAILAAPSILILDEATSSLDSESEALIQDGLARLRRGRTTFVIAHRLSTIRAADQILVLEGGEVVERGTHAELLARNGRYAEMWRLQQSGDDNEAVRTEDALAK